MAKERISPEQEIVDDAVEAVRVLNKNVPTTTEVSSYLCGKYGHIVEPSVVFRALSKDSRVGGSYERNIGLTRWWYEG
jgi:hypothetical protein